jgi:hypothetical protein
MGAAIARGAKDRSATEARARRIYIFMGFSFFWRRCAQDERRLIFHFSVCGIGGEMCKTYGKRAVLLLDPIRCKNG